MKTRMDINCDLGESCGAFRVGDDSKIMSFITSANIACGFHAGDPVTMMKTIDLAKKHNVAVGAHPGFPDLMGFGRREIELTSEEAETYVLYQVSALQGFAKAASIRLQHVKPHGALYNMAVEDQKLSKAIVDAVKALDNALIVFAQPKSALAKAAVKAGLRIAYEFFADRAYNPDGSLVSRKQANAVIQEPRKVVKRAVKAVTEGTVLAVNGEELNLGKIHTICVHGDTPIAVKLAEVLRKGLVKAGVEVEPVGKFV
jgi:UPF0271 protein